jgi:hypothetical protein
LIFYLIEFFLVFVCTAFLKKKDKSVLFSPRSERSYFSMLGFNVGVERRPSSEASPRTGPIKEPNQFFGFSN